MVTRRSSTITSFVKLSQISRVSALRAVNTQVGANGGLVLIAKPLVDILVHERCLADTVGRGGVRGRLTGAQ
jgi:hypothetical protein